MNNLQIEDKTLKNVTKSFLSRILAALLVGSEVEVKVFYDHLESCFCTQLLEHDLSSSLNTSIVHGDKL